MWTGDVDSGAQARARRAYYASVAHVDEQIGVVLGAWRALPHSADDGAGLGGVVLFLSAHGEMLGDHLLFRKGYAYEGSARVPLLVCVVLLGNVLPVVESPLAPGQGFLGKPIVGKADAHIARVATDTATHGDSVPLPCMPARWDAVRSFAEVVVRDEAQVLPLGYLMVDA